MYYENFEKLCEQRNVKPAHVSRETGVKTATLTSWKKGVYTPKQDKLQQIADYFNVTLEYLMTGEEKKSSFSEESAKLVGKIRNDKDLSNALEKYFTLSEAKKKHVLELIDLLSEV